MTIPGFYDDVEPLSAYERKQFTRLPFNARELPEIPRRAEALRRARLHAASSSAPPGPRSRSTA